MSGPRDLSQAELELFGLAVIERHSLAGEPVTRIYCARCGSQVAPERRDADPNWWTCARRCNAQYAAAEAPLPPVRSTT